MSLFSPDLSVTGSSSPLKSNRKPATGGNPKKKTPVSSYVYITILVCSLQVHRNFENLFYSSWRGVRRWSIEYQGSWHRDNYSQRLLHLINECLFFFLHRTQSERDSSYAVTDDPSEIRRHYAASAGSTAAQCWEVSLDDLQPFSNPDNALRDALKCLANTEDWWVSQVTDCYRVDAAWFFWLNSLRITFVSFLLTSGRRSVKEFKEFVVLQNIILKCWFHSYTQWLWLS